jgi:hypothetical protein
MEKEHKSAVRKTGPKLTGTMPTGITAQINERQDLLDDKYDKMMKCMQEQQ